MDKLNFKNGKLTILQISDAQDTQWVRHTMVSMLEKACEKVNPDLIVFTGDNILGNHLSDYRFGSGQRKLTRKQEYKILKRALRHVFRIPEDRGIPFAVVFGNHDDRNSFTKDEQADIFRAYNMNRGCENTGKLCGTYRLPVYSTDGTSKLLDLYMIDTAYYDRQDDKCYDEVLPETVEWFKAETVAAAQEGDANALMFMHIPLEEVAEFVDVDEETHKVSLRSDCTGKAGEPVTPVEKDNGFYDAVLENGKVSMIISGHDHTNNFIGEKDGIKFVATPAASFRCYGSKDSRGVRVFEIDENNPDSVNTYTLSMTDLLGDNILTTVRYFLDADEMEKAKYITLGVAGIAAVAGGIIKKCKSK